MLKAYNLSSATCSVIHYHTKNCCISEISGLLDFKTIHRSSGQWNWNFIGHTHRFTGPQKPLTQRTSQKKPPVYPKELRSTLVLNIIYSCEGLNVTRWEKTNHRYCFYLSKLTVLSAGDGGMYDVGDFIIISTCYNYLCKLRQLN